MKYSIIVPIYNKSEYLDECINSIIAQKNEDMEILLINDGSTDNSIDICKKYEKQDGRIVVFDKENSGVSDTRNFGILKAKGEYIVFVDADDVIAPDFFSFVDPFVENQDILLYKSCRKFKELGKESGYTGFLSLEKYPNTILKNVIYNHYSIPNCEFNFNRVTDYVISAKMLKENGIFFNTALKIGEDKFFNFKLFQKAKRIAYVNKCLYYIRTNGQSVMGKYTPDALKANVQMYLVFEDEVALLADENLRGELQPYMHCLAYQVVRNSIGSDYCHKNNPMSLKERREMYKACEGYLNNGAIEKLRAYDKYLFSVFHYPFFWMNIIMKNRLVRGGWYVLRRMIKHI